MLTHCLLSAKKDISTMQVGCIALNNKELSALIISGKDGMIVSIGDRIEGYTVHKITHNEVILQAKEKEYTLNLYHQKVLESTVEKESDEKKKNEFKVNWPCTIRKITSGFGYRQHPLGGGRLFHKGIDIAVSRGTPVYAAAGGIIAFTGRSGAYGNLVKIDHEKGYQSRYGHLKKYVVKKGDLIGKGQLIAYSGNTGRSSGPHLHFEIRKGGIPINPKKILNK